MQEKYYVQPPRGGLKPGLSFGYVDVPQHLTPDKRPFLDSLTKASLEVQQQIRKGREIDIPTRDVWIDANGRKTTLRLFLPQGEGPFPLVLYCHGGGFAIRNVDCFDYIGRYLAKNGPAVVVMPEYALAPEHPFPTQLEQCCGALRWARAHAQELCADEMRDVVAGDSAGGNLSAAICLKFRDEGLRQPAMQILAYPVTDAVEGCGRESERLYATGYNLDYQHLLAYNEAYASAKQRELPYVSPLRAKTLNHLAPCYMISAECDILIDQGLAYLQRLKEAGVPTGLRIFRGMPHDFLFFDYDESYEAYDLMCRLIEKTGAADALDNL